ncbi:recombinase family protein [Candidatus Enterococcus willemsii]|uniref:Resolvase n=1 Tax=Candidatus Enterococcus willemsii TaxID=1857215 RepID=A0ABQ6Z090_9ENTE|nr:recombinase family protein [Enterococcus sp. CU12B]KAF1304367.1 resolvase [Enterococcus sp. CU12B]
MNLFGYIRTTITDGDPQAQLAQLTAYGCAKIFHEDCVNPGPVTLETVLAEMQAGDVIVVDQLQRLGKSTRQLAEWMMILEERQLNLVCLNEQIDTREAAGKLYFQWMNHMATMERALLKERTLVGLNKARQQGKIGGRPKIDPKTVAKIRFLFFEKKESIQTIATLCQVSIGTCYKYIHLNEEDAQLLLGNK